MGARLNIEIKDVDEATTFVRLSGVIDEDNELGQISSKVKPESTVIVDTSDIQRINSCGVRDWVTWLGQLNGKACKLFFLECSPAIMTQVNLVNNFLNKGQIITFYAPYFCSSCEADKMLLINVDQALKSESYQAPVCRCDQCDHTMEFDDIESSYFAFLNTIKPPQMTPKLLDQIKEISQASQGQLRTRSTSMPMPSLSSTPSVPSMPTTPSARNLKGLLTDVPSSQGTATPSVGVGKILYVIVGLLAAAIGLLAYVVLRAS
jgi:anti-anti-sigma regulatory factor